MQRYFKKRVGGFTLIELLVVIAIIGILATIVGTNLSSARAKSRDAKRVADVKNIQLALEQYYNDNLQYPINIYAASGSLKPSYMSAVPFDPVAATPCTDGTQGSCYKYVTFNAPGTTNCSSANPPVKYHLGAVLEISGADGTGHFASDADAATTNNVCSGSVDTVDFNGLSSGGVSGTAKCTGTQGATGATENCYDAVN